jgi:hypothetical protein
LLEIEATYKAEIINTAEYLKTKCTAVEVANIVKSHESNQPNTNSTITAAEIVAGELKQSNEKIDTNNEGIQHIKAKLGVLKKWRNKVK